MTQHTHMNILPGKVPSLGPRVSSLLMSSYAFSPVHEHRESHVVEPHRIVYSFLGERHIRSTAIIIQLVIPHTAARAALGEEVVGGGGAGDGGVQLIEDAKVPCDGRFNWNLRRREHLDR